MSDKMSVRQQHAILVKMTKEERTLLDWGAKETSSRGTAGFMRQASIKEAKRLKRLKEGRDG